MKAPSSLKISLSSRLPELRRLSTWIEDAAHRMNFTTDLAFALQLCVEEAVANIMMYGGAQGRTPITIELRTTKDCLTAIIEDGMASFDPTQVTPRIPPVSLEESQIGGLGIHLIRHYSSEMHYERLGDRNRLTLTLNRLAAVEI